MIKSHKENSLLSNTLDTFKKIIGYDLSSLRVVFEHEGDEIVFINNSWTFQVRVYVNGQLVYSGWDWTFMVSSRGWFLHNAKTYKIKGRISDILTFAQCLTLSVDGEVVETKIDPYYGKLTVKEVCHLSFGVALLGSLIVMTLKAFGL